MGQKHVSIQARYARVLMIIPGRAGLLGRELSPCVHGETSLPTSPIPFFNYYLFPNFDFIFIFLFRPCNLCFLFFFLE